MIFRTIFLKRVHSKSLYDEFKEIKFIISTSNYQNHIKYFESLYGKTGKTKKVFVLD